MRMPTGLPVLFIVCFVTLLAVENAQGCSCVYSHPQHLFCTSDYGDLSFIAIKVKEKIPSEYETAYKVKINRKFKLTNDSFNEYLYNGYLYTASYSSACGAELVIGESYVVGGRVFEGKPRLSLCDLVMRWSDVSKRQRKGFKSLYAKGCMCDVKYTAFQRKGEALHRANGRLCPWEGNPGPTDCQEKHGICVSNQGRCFWMPSRPYDQCIRDHYQSRLIHQRPRELP